MASFDITAGTNYDVEIPFTNHEPGIQLGTVEITDYPVVFDDQMFIVYNVAGSIPVLAINGNQEIVDWLVRNNYPEVAALAHAIRGSEEATEWLFRHNCRLYLYRSSDGNPD